jgi:hypothetical protein
VEKPSKEMQGKLEDFRNVENRKELNESARKLTRLLLRKLEEGMNEKAFDEAQIRLISQISVRALKLWEKISRDDLNLEKRVEQGIRILTNETDRVLGTNRSGEGEDGTE